MHGVVQEYWELPSTTRYAPGGFVTILVALSAAFGFARSVAGRVAGCRFIGRPRRISAVGGLAGGGTVGVAASVGIELGFGERTSAVSSFTAAARRPHESSMRWRVPKIAAIITAALTIVTARPRAHRNSRGVSAASRAGGFRMPAAIGRISGFGLTGCSPAAKRIRCGRRHGRQTSGELPMGIGFHLLLERHAFSIAKTKSLQVGYRSAGFFRQRTPQDRIHRPIERWIQLCTCAGSSCTILKASDGIESAANGLSPVSNS